MNLFKVYIQYKEIKIKIYIQPSQTINDLKFEIMKNTKVKIDEQIISYLNENNQIMLSNEKTIEYYKIKNGDVLTLNVQNNNNNNNNNNKLVIINNYLNQKYFFKLKKNDKISDLKNKLINKFNLEYKKSKIIL